MNAEASAPAPPQLLRPLSLAVLGRVFFRSLFIQAAWNPQGMQNLGLTYALYPALKHLYPDEPRLRAAIQRHMAVFNTHPYVAAAIVGGVLFHEERVARGEESPERVVAFKGALMGPLAALGDGFFWLSLRPAAGALSAALVPAFQAWAPVLFLVVYNVVHGWLRGRMFWMGLMHGDELVEILGRSQLPRRGAWLRSVAAVCAGGLVAWLAIVFGRNEGGALGSALAGFALAVGGLAYWGVSKGLSRHAALYGAAALAVICGVFL